MILSNKGITKALIRLRRCVGWFVSVLFANPRRQFSRVEAQLGTYSPPLCLKSIKFKQYLFRKYKAWFNKTIIYRQITGSENKLQCLYEKQATLLI